MGWRGCLGNHPPLPVSSCKGTHQRPHEFCLSTRLWMKELARAQFQLFIACKPERWREREGMWGSVCVCGWMHPWVGFSVQWVCVAMCMHVITIIPALFLPVLSHSLDSPVSPVPFSLFLSFSSCYVSSSCVATLFIQPLLPLRSHHFASLPFSLARSFSLMRIPRPPAWNSHRFPVITICFGWAMKAEIGFSCRRSI